MQIIKRGDLRLLLSDEGKHIRSIDDVYVPEHIDPETGQVVPEHFPHYSQMIFLAKQIKDDEVEDLYIEEYIIKND